MSEIGRQHYPSGSTGAHVNKQYAYNNIKCHRSSVHVAIERRHLVRTYYNDIASVITVSSTAVGLVIRQLRSLQMCPKYESLHL